MDGDQRRCSEKGQLLRRLRITTPERVAGLDKPVEPERSLRQIDKQFAAMHGADVGATGAAAKELDALQKRRADLYKQIGDQIKRETNRIAKDQGFTTVFVDITAAAGGYDMTNELIKDVEGLHE